MRAAIPFSTLCAIAAACIATHALSACKSSDATGADTSDAGDEGGSSAGYVWKCDDDGGIGFSEPYEDGLGCENALDGDPSCSDVPLTGQSCADHDAGAKGRICGSCVNTGSGYSYSETPCTCSPGS